METETIDAHKWIKSLRLEYWHVSRLRKLRVGEQFWIGYFDGPGVVDGLAGHCEAYIERVTGGYSFEGVWTLPWGKATRCHILTYGRFQLFKGNRISFCDEDSRGSEKSFRTICRYVAFINRHAKEYGISPIWLGHPYHCHALWRGMAVGKDGFTRDGVAGPEPKGLSAIVDTAIALGVLEDEDAA